MKILNVNITNFLGIGEAKVRLNRGGVTLVEGENNDSSSSLSNGAGKSTVFEAVFWAMYGSTRRGSKADEVVNRYTKGGCLVRVLLEIAGKHCAITRTRLHGPDKKSELTLEFDGDDLTKGTTKETQVAIDAMVGMSQLTFQKAVFFGQGDVKPFACLTDSELKSVFEQALGLTWYSESRAKVQGFMAGLKQQVDRSSTDIQLLTGNRDLAQHRADGMRDSIASAEEAEKTWQKTRVDEVSEKTTMVETWAAENAGLEGHAVAIRAAVGEKEKKVEELQALKTKLNAAVDGKMGEVARMDSSVHTGKRAIMELEQRRNGLEGMAGTVCAACLQPVGRDGVDRALTVLTKKKDEALSLCEEQGKILGDAKVRYNELRTMADQLSMKVDAIRNEIQTDKAKLGQIAGRTTTLDGEISRYTARINVLADELKAGNGNSREAIEDLNRKLSMMVVEVELANQKIKDTEDGAMEALTKLNDVALLSEALGNAGVKSYVFDSVTPELNEWSNRYLQVLDPDIGVEISTVTKLKTGEYREKFSVGVSHAAGANTLSGFSGGERQKVNLAVALGFNRLMRSMAAGDAPMMVLDEPFEALDAGSSDQVIELLKMLDSDDLYLITHNESVRDLIPHRMIVEKKGGVATVREVA